MPVEESTLREREPAPVAQWIEQLTSDHPGRYAVLSSVRGGAKRVELSAVLLPRPGRNLAPARQGCVWLNEMAVDAPSRLHACEHVPPIIPLWTGGQ